MIFFLKYGSMFLARSSARLKASALPRFDPKHFSRNITMGKSLFSRSARLKTSTLPRFDPKHFSRNITMGRFLFSRSADLLTDEERKAYSRLFKEMDKDNDGIISKEELRKGLQDFIGYEATDTELNESMVVLDKDKDGKVGIKDFLEHMQTRKRETRLEAIRFTFEMWDSNADGYIERSDLKNMLKAVGEEPSDAKVDKILSTSDHDKDGKLSFSEFKEIFKDKHF